MCKVAGGCPFVSVFVRIAIILCLLTVSVSAGAEPEQEGDDVRESYVFVQTPPAQPPVPSPDRPTPKGEWYGHWHLLSGVVASGLYTAAVWGTSRAEGDETIAAGIGTGYLLLGFSMMGGGIHAAYDNEVGVVLSSVLRLLGGALAPGIVAATCDGASGDACDAAATLAAAVGTGVPVLLDAFVLSWE